jgi:hypothetical protein
MLLKHSLPISQRRLSLLLPLRNILQIRVPRLESTSDVELLHCSIIRVADAFHTRLAMVVAATEWSDGTLPAALADDLTARLAEVLDVLRVESTFEVFDPGDSGE